MVLILVAGAWFIKSRGRRLEQHYKKEVKIAQEKLEIALRQMSEHQDSLGKKLWALYNHDDLLEAKLRLGREGGAKWYFATLGKLMLAIVGGLFVSPGKPRKKTGRSLSLLGAFGWFCSKENRKHIELIRADLKKDARQMRQEGRGRFFVAVVLLWHTVFGTMLPIMWDGICRLLKAVLPVGKLISGIKGTWLK